MASPTYNPTFKRPVSVRPAYTRSPSPPHAFVEPLSPPKPAPIEPNFNYPALSDNSLHFSPQAPPVFAATPRPRAYSTNYHGGHHRTPSTIDTLAEVALAASASYNTTPSRNNASSFEHGGFGHAHPSHHNYGHSEPPHKRARSEIFPPPQMGYHASRPATSYESSQGYSSRVEEAALLLNFSAHVASSSSRLPSASAGSRPHANSFPQSDVHSQLPRNPLAMQAPLLPPFSALDIRPLPQLASVPEQAAQPVNHFPVAAPGEAVMQDVKMLDFHAEHPRHDFTEQAITTTDDSTSHSGSADVTASETSEKPKRRGWPKGKPRSAGARKTLAEKAASKRATSRKKASQLRNPRKNAEAAATDAGKPPQERRKSMSDAFVFGEQESNLNNHEGTSRSQSVPRDNHMIIREATTLKQTRRKPNVHPDTICAGCQTSRETATSRCEFDEWISCNGCKKWYHIDCAGFKKAHDVRDVDKYFCQACEPQHGKTTYVRKSTRAHASVDYAELQRGVLKTSEESTEHHYIKPIKDGSFQFDQEMFPRMRPEMVTRDFFEKSGTFTEPICIPAAWNPRPWAEKEARSHGNTDQQDGDVGSDPLTAALTEDFEYDTMPDRGQDRLEMVMPQGLTVRSVCNLVGGDWPIDVIDVKTQNSGAKWTLSRWADYYEDVSEDKAIRNVISLEVSQTKLGRLLQRPKVVRDLDLQDDVWPQEEIDKGKFPKVQFYCLMSVADSYTDFHIDFGGSSVYYHILKGKKTFFFIPPKAKHLKAYEEWNDSPQQNYTFLPSITKECYRVDLSEGDTMLIPSGWIHAVWTPEDSLVIGGNFLNRLSYKNQFRVVEIEKNNETPMKFRYPSFQKVMWYTAIKYLETDLMPQEVSQRFYEGKQFVREVPVWADFDGNIARNDARPGAANARYYSQAEMEGLPELVNFIFRTVMLVMGRVEGISADRMKRVNASIPKGYGEPLEIAKTFALWAAWKRGNEDPPAWAHPDAVLPHGSKEDGAPKKLSERKLKELERKEAIAAWRVAPDRQSVRVMAKTQASAIANTNATSFADSSSPAPAPSRNHQMQTPSYQNHQYAPPPATSSTARPPAEFINGGALQPANYLSTPKTSVLGPKRVACDACRKRRIKCKHKDLVQQVAANGTIVDPALRASLGPDVGDDITVSPSKQGIDGGLMNRDGEMGRATPGTSAYVAQNIPMFQNGVPIFGESVKKGRTKACYECRRSKRRCVHDENGFVDPTKAAEPPVPRGSSAAKKRAASEQQSPLLKKVKLHSASPAPTPAPPASHSPAVQSAPQPAGQTNGNDMQRMNGSTHHSPVPDQNNEPPPLYQHQPQQRPAHLDPELYGMYHHQSGAYHPNGFDYHHTDQMHHYQQPTNGYHIPSLEQIASEVLDMDGPEREQDGFDQLRAFVNTDAEMAAMSDGLPHAEDKPDGSVDSGVSLPADDSQQRLEDQKVEERITNGDGKAHGVAALPNGGVGNELPPPDAPAVNGTVLEEPTSPAAQSVTSSKRDVTSSLPLYQPPGPPLSSPTSVKKQPLKNGVHPAHSPEVTTQSMNGKRKQESVSTPTGKGKKARLSFGAENAVPLAVVGEADKESVELARMLQQEDLGLRRRASRGN